MPPTSGHPTEEEPSGSVRVRPTQPGDFPAIVEMSRAVYPPRAAWREEELSAHLTRFPEGQLVAVVSGTSEAPGKEAVVGMAASLILAVDDYPHDANWWTLTGQGHFFTHDPELGDTLYGAGVLVHPEAQGKGVGTQLYGAREELARGLGLSRIVAGARISGFHQHAHRLSAGEYVERVVAGELTDPTLSFQLNMGFRVLRVVKDYLPEDRESLSNAAVVEWRESHSGE